MDRNKLIPLLLCFLVFISCSGSGEKKDWRNAKSENSISAYEDYLKLYPEGQFIESAITKIEAIDFEQAKAGGDINEYLIFLKLYPDSDFVSEITELLEEKGTIVELAKEELVLIEGLSGGISDRCWLEYLGHLETESKDEDSERGFNLWHKREGFDSEKIEIDSIEGNVGQVLGGTWERRLLRKGQVIGYTEYDVYGRPKKTTSVPIETVSLGLKFILISSSDSQAKVLILPESKIVSKKQ